MEIEVFDEQARRYSELKRDEECWDVPGDIARGRRQLWKALEARDDEREDPQVRREAAKVVRGLVSGRQGFEDTLKGLRRVRRLKKRAARKRSEKMRRAKERPTALSDGLALRNLLAAGSLKQVGQALGNCVAKGKTARRYLEDQRMWVLEDRDKRPLLLIAMDEDGDISECQGSFPEPLSRDLPPDERKERHKHPEPLPPAIARGIMDKIGARGDLTKVFTLGSRGTFRDGVPDADPVEADGLLHRVWTTDGSCVIATKDHSGRRERWSRFILKERRLEMACAGQHLSARDLLRLMSEHPEFCRALAGI